MWVGVWIQKQSTGGCGCGQTGCLRLRASAQTCRRQGPLAVPGLGSRGAPGAKGL